jgi:hypothetical protein
MDPTTADEYPVRLSTGETIQVAEIDEERTPLLADPQVKKAISGLLQHCCHTTRDVMEEAKGGYDGRFKLCLRAAPIGCMIKSEPHICRLIDDCAMAYKPVCTLHNASPQSPKPLPICWEFDPPVDDPVTRTAAAELGSVIGHAWRRGLYVVIVK